MKNNKLITIPNILSSYRIIIFPYILYLALTGQEQFFALFLCINLITDVLDGFIARNFNQKTEIGAKLDSTADVGTYILAFMGVYLFKFNEFAQHPYPILVFLFLYLTFHLVSFLKFGRNPSLHTYLFKSTGWLQGIFFFVLFTSGFTVWFYYLAVLWGIVACIEELIIIMILPKPTSNVKGLYWVLKSLS